MGIPFKILKGLNTALPSTKEEGNVYYTYDNSMFHIDYTDSSGNLVRKTLNADQANKLITARKITLSGGVSGSASFDGSGDITITTTVTDDSHNHIIDNVDGLQDALDLKLNSEDLKVTADQALHFSITSDGILQVSY